MFFDTHAHLDITDFSTDREAVINRARKAGVDLIVNVGFNLQTARSTVELAKRYDFIYGAVGMHPHDAKDMDEKAYEELKKLSGQSKIVAVGEIGLDYYRDHSPRDVQKSVFRRMIALAKEIKKPVIIHDRDAHQDVFDIVKEEGAREVGGVFHCYSGSWPLAREALKLGFYISLAGPLTFHNAGKLQEVAQMVPLDYLLIETDCPYLAPAPYRGKRNEPAHVVKVAERLAQIKKLPVEEVAMRTRKNGIKVFKIPEDA
ncbi:MAG: TatD family hydrolase [Peptococcaceae bacterium]|jgi:TatD DNase family protein|nr:TatD family hydrolase [Peptococcaceae bacterium]MDH7525194.1 TatD family hydrolase [Peptococcaceae bacterium]